MILGGARLLSAYSTEPINAARLIWNSPSPLAAWDRIKANPDILVAIITGEGQAFPRVRI
jgi:hypothetical protein